MTEVHQLKLKKISKLFKPLKTNFNYDDRNATHAVHSASGVLWSSRETAVVDARARQLKTTQGNYF